MSIHHRLVIEVEAELIDPSWTERDLLENAAHFLQSAIDRAQNENARAYPDEPYTLDTADLTVWTQGDYLEDLQSLLTDPSPALRDRADRQEPTP